MPSIDTAKRFYLFFLEYVKTSIVKTLAQRRIKIERKDVNRAFIAICP